MPIPTITSLEIASASQNGTVGPGQSLTYAFGQQRISADGRYVIFETFDGGLSGPNGVQSENVVVKDMLTGAVSLVSVRDEIAALVPGAIEYSFAYNGTISGDGRYVAFQFQAGFNVAGGLVPTTYIAVRDMGTGTTTLVSSGVGGIKYKPSISSDGSHVVFLAINQVTGGQSLYLSDRFGNDATLIDGNLLLGGAPDNYNPTLSGDGRFVAYSSGNPGLPGATGGISFYLLDTSTGDITRIGPQESAGALSFDGRYLVYSEGHGLNGLIKVYDREAAQTKTLGDGSSPTISDNGQFVAWLSSTPGRVSVYDLLGDQLAHFDIPQGNAPIGFSALSISDDGRHLTFYTFTNLLPGDGNNTSDVYVITLSPWNFDPVITSDGGGAAAVISIAENTSVATTVLADDADDDTLTYAIVGGADAAKFTIAPATGALSFLSPPDFEAPTDAGGDNIYDVTVQVSDGRNGFDTQAISITVSDVNEAPVFTSVPPASIPENTTLVSMLASVDPDAGQTLTYSIAGGTDASLFEIRNGNELHFISAPDHEAPADAGADNIYDVDVRVSDGAGGTATQAINIAVTDVDEIPPNTAPVAGNGSVDTSEDTSITFDPRDFAFDPDGDPLEIVDFATQVGTAVLNPDGTVTYTPDADFNGSDALTYKVSDGRGGEDSGLVEINIAPVNDIAIIGGARTGVVAEDGTLVASGQMAVNDPDDGEASFQEGTVAAAYGSFVLTAGGQWTYTLNNAHAAVQGLNAGQTRTDTIVVRTLDGTESSVAVTINGANETTVITNGPGGGTVNGTSGDDTFDTGAGADTINAGAGNDMIDAGTGNDTINAGAGNDIVVAGVGNDIVDGGTGNDIIDGGSGTDIVAGGAGNDTLTGGAGSDVVDGGAGNDTFLATTGDGGDIFIGGAGIDTYDLSAISGGVTVNLGTSVLGIVLDGVGTASGGQIGTDVLTSIENAIGGSGNDTLNGDNQANRLVGGAGVDTINGRGGNDIIEGGSGNDVLTGGAGSDMFVFKPGFGNDRIADFDANPAGGQDLLELSGFGIAASNFADLVQITDVGADTLVTISGDLGQSIRLTGIGNAATVTVDDFRFS